MRKLLTLLFVLVLSVPSHAASTAQEIAALKARVAVLETKVATLMTQNAAQDAAIAALKAQMAALEARVAALETTDPPDPPPTDAALLAQADFTYLGIYTVPNTLGGGELNWGQGFTARRVGGQLRFFTFRFHGQRNSLIEFAEPAALGGTVMSTVNQWDEFVDTWSAAYWIGLSWDEAHQRMWFASTPDYDSATLNSETGVWSADLGVPAMTWHGPVGLAGVGERQMYGGVVDVPAWFRQQYGVGPKAFGFGGYTSLMAQGNYPVSLGLALWAGPDLFGLADHTAAAGAAVLANHQSGTVTTDWYASGAPTLLDRGTRNADVTNEYDSGHWLSPAPDGLGRWVWGDSPWNTGVWIDTPAKRGFLLVPTFSSGRAWYEGSTLHRDRLTTEIQVFDPAHFGQVVGGSRQPWNVQPTTRFVIPIPNMTQCCLNGNAPFKSVAGAYYDGVSKRLYLYVTWTDSLDSEILVYAVNS